jgi:hypothetical protein
VKAPAASPRLSLRPYRLGDEGRGDLLFCGGTLFFGSVTRPHLAAEDERELAFVQRITASLSLRPANAEEIRAMSLGAREVAEETAFQPECGPNTCAAE